MHEIPTFYQNFRQVQALKKTKIMPKNKKQWYNCLLEQIMLETIHQRGVAFAITPLDWDPLRCKVPVLLWAAPAQVQPHQEGRNSNLPCLHLLLLNLEGSTAYQKRLYIKKPWIPVKDLFVSQKMFPRKYFLHFIVFGTFRKIGKHSPDRKGKMPFLMKITFSFQKIKPLFRLKEFY